MKNNISIFKLFTTFFKINALTFGGGYTIVPIIKDVFVNEFKLISEEDMLDIVAIAQGGPGAMAISTSVLTGYKLKGVLGAITTLVASSLPCLIILSTISIFYENFRTNFYVHSILSGISGVICAVLLLTVYNMARISYNKYPGFSLILMVLVFLLGFFLKVKTSYLIFLCAFLGIAVFFVLDRRNKNE